MNLNLTGFLVLFSVASSIAQEPAKISLKDFRPLIGDWQGTLTYLDYSSGKPYTMPADITIRRIRKTNKLVFANSYPQEPQANSADTLTIAPDGQYLDAEWIKSRKVLATGELEIITEEMGEDGNDNRAATFRHTYLISKTTFRRRKDVQFSGEQEWINRHEYAYQIKPRQ